MHVWRRRGSIWAAGKDAPRTAACRLADHKRGAAESRCAKGKPAGTCHKQCALTWFGKYRTDIKCDVCLAECRGLPAEVRQAIALRAARQRHYANLPEEDQDETEGENELFPDFGASAAGMHPLSFSLGCLTACSASVVVLIIFFFEVVGVDAFWSLLLGTVLPGVVLAQWLVQPGRILRLWAFTAVYLSAILVMTQARGRQRAAGVRCSDFNPHHTPPQAFLDEVGLRPLQAALAGSSCGAGLAFLVFLGLAGLVELAVDCVVVLCRLLAATRSARWQGSRRRAPVAATYLGRGAPLFRQHVGAPES